MIRLLLTLLLATPSAARAQAFAAFPSEAAFLGQLDALRLDMAARIKSSRVVRRHSEGLTHEEALAMVLARLAAVGVPEDYARAAFADPRLRLYPDIPGKFKRPKAAVDYDEVKRRVISEERVLAGVAFVTERRELLSAVQARYGVDAMALAGLSGIETFYGRSAGTYPVISALYTIVRLVPGRSEWAARELAEFLKLSRADANDPHAQLGSYAGAFGFVQFIPSSFNRLAVDFDGDGRKRLDAWPDALGSAANYLAVSGWEPGGSLAPGSRNWMAIHAYNHSDTYVRLVLDLRQAILTRCGTGCISAP